jgi:collagenase-like PrtC family protease
VTDTVLSVGYDGALADLREIIGCSPRVKTVFTGGLSGLIKGGRPQYAGSLPALKKQIRYAHARGVSFEVAVNAPCGIHDRSDTGWWRKVRQYILALEALDVDGVIVSHPFLMELVKSCTEMKIAVSAICEISSAGSARYYEQLGGDIITPSINANMDMAALKLIKKSLKRARLRILLNDYCLSDCPWRRFHYNHYAHSNSEMDYHLNCRKLFHDHPYLILANTAIRPEDMKYYKGCADEFKIAGRLVPLEDLLRRIRAYTDEAYEGNFVSLLDTRLAKAVHIPNGRLEGLIRKKWKCSRLCDTCGYCGRLFRRIGRVICR